MSHTPRADADDSNMVHVGVNDDPQQSPFAEVTEKNTSVSRPNFEQVYPDGLPQLTAAQIESARRVTHIAGPKVQVEG